MAPGPDHDWNSYENHVGLIRKHFDSYSAYYDESAGEQEHTQFSEPIQANEVFEELDEQVDSKRPVVFFGVHILKYGHDSVKFSWAKRLELRQAANRVQSRTCYYTYNLTWKGKWKGAEVTRLLRFDNQDDDHGHETPNHFHLEVHSKVALQDGRPKPAHIGLGYPHSDGVIRLGVWMLEHQFDLQHKKAFQVFSDLKSADRMKLAAWLPKVSAVLTPLTQIVRA